MRDIVLWVLTVEILGLAASAPLAAFFGNRRDAALLSRPVGLALVAYLGWALSLSRSIGFERGTLLLALVLLGLISFFVGRTLRRQSGVREPFWGREERRAALLFWMPTAFFLLIRAAVPEILGAEKFMDLGFFNSLLRHGAMPPLDPWMSGKTINYYYWGYLLAAVLAKLAGVSSYVAYNLAVPTFAGYSFVAAACLGMRLSGGRQAAGVWAGAGAVIAGNLTGAIDAWRAPFARDFDYWHASRVIAPPSGTINEFPFFTFFHADLHPHLLAFPFFLATFAAAHRYLEFPLPASGSRAGIAGRIGRAWPPLLLALLAGTARAANNWTLPAIALLLAVTCAFRSTAGRRLPSPGDALWGAVTGVVLLLLSLILWYPYTRSYRLEVQGLAPTSVEKSQIFEFLGVWGLLFGAAYLALWPARSSRSEQPAARQGALGAALLAMACLLLAFLTRAPALLVLLPLAALAARAAARSWKTSPEDSGVPFAAFLLLLAIAMIAGCEFIYFKDSYGVDLQRMNTIFKFYNQAWPLVAVAAAVFGERAWRRSNRSFSLLRLALTALIVVSLFYPIEAAVSRFRQSSGGWTLDARRPLVRRSPGDAAAITWLERHAPPRSVVLEASGNPYLEYARVSSHTGIPTVLGWANHEGLWRSNAPEVAQRASEIRAFYESDDPGNAARMLQKYGVTFVILGDLERATYPAAARVASYAFLQPVFPGQTIVYQVSGR